MFDCVFFMDSGWACRIRVLRELQSKFHTPKEAERHFIPELAPASQSIPEGATDLTASQGDEQLKFRLPPVGSPDDVSSTGSLAIERVDTLISYSEHIARMPTEDQLRLAGEVYSMYLSKEDVSVPEDFLKLVAQGMVQLQNAGRSNILYSLAKGLGTMRPDGSDSIFPSRQLVTGLVEHCANFFAASFSEQVSIIAVRFVILFYLLICINSR